MSDKRERARSERAVYYSLLVLLLVSPTIMTAYVPLEALKWYMIRVFGVSIFAVWVTGRALRSAPSVRWDPISILAGALLITQAMSLFVATNVGLGLEEISKYAGLLAVFFLVANVPSSDNERDGIFWAVALVGTSTALYGIAQHLGYDFFPWEENYLVPVSRGVSFFGHATFAGSVLVLCIFLTCGLAWVQRGIPGKVFLTFLTLLMLYHLSFSGARIATVSFLAGSFAIGVAYLLRWREETKERRSGARLSYARLLAMVSIVTLMMSAGGFLVFRAWEAKGSDLLGLRDSSLPQRFYAWETASRVFLDNPILGIGVGNYGTVSPAYWSDIEANRYAVHERMFYQVHNEYLETAVEQGLPGICVLLALTAFALTSSYGLWMRAHNPMRRRLGLFLFGAVVTASLDATITFTHQTPGPALLYWVVLGLVSREVAVETRRSS